MEADHNKFQIVTKPSICNRLLLSPKIKLVYCSAVPGSNDLLNHRVVSAEYLVVGGMYD